MNIDEQIEELRNAYKQGFLSDQDFESKLSQLVNANKKVETTTLSDEAGQLLKRVIKSEMVTDMATGAVGGAVIASVVPFVGTAAGVVVGASLGAYKNFAKGFQPHQNTTHKE